MEKEYKMTKKNLEGQIEELKNEIAKDGGESFERRTNVNAKSHLESLIKAQKLGKCCNKCHMIWSKLINEVRNKNAEASKECDCGNVLYVTCKGNEYVLMSLA